MIILLALITRRDATLDEILDWFRVARQAAVEVPGVYDLALYSIATSNSTSLWCALDVEDERASSACWQDQQVQEALRLGRELGLELAVQTSWQRLV